MYLHSRYKKAKKFQSGGAVILGNGEDAIMRPPPGEPPPMDDFHEDISEDAAPADQVALAIQRARSFRNEVPAVKVEPPVNERRFSAPVSRESVSYNGKRQETARSITLTAAQTEAARISGISIVDYARNLILLREAKAADPDKYGSS